MSLECPNCRARVSFFRTFRTTAWGRFPCKVCGSVLGIAVGRRFLAVGVWVAAVVLLMRVARIQAYGTIGFAAIILCLMLLILYCMERVVLIERRAFTCRQCGYSLEKLTEPRCPECGSPFDPAERQRILERIASGPPRPRFRWATVIAIVLLAALLAANLFTFFHWSQAAKPPAPPASPPPNTAPATPTL